MWNNEELRSSENQWNAWDRDSWTIIYGVVRNVPRLGWFNCGTIAARETEETICSEFQNPAGQRGKSWYRVQQSRSFAAEWTIIGCVLIILCEGVGCCCTIHLVISSLRMNVAVATLPRVITYLSVPVNVHLHAREIIADRNNYSSRKHHHCEVCAASGPFCTEFDCIDRIYMRNCYNSNWLYRSPQFFVRNRSFIEFAVVQIRWMHFEIMDIGEKNIQSYWCY